MNIEFLQKFNMISAGDKLLCAVSGGADSMCLMHIMKENADKMGITAMAAHFNHKLRGEEADRDEAFVCSWCEENGVKFISGSGDVRKYAENEHLSIEEAARVLRYEFLENAAESFGCNKIATAHNADDNAETVLLNLTRGAGAKGLCGIPPVRGKFIRPILNMSRAEIEEYLEKNNVPHIEDSTNASDDYSRNKIRHKAVPILREINPAFSRAVMRTSELMREDEMCLNEIAQSFIDENLSENSLPREKLRALPRAVQSRVFRIMCGRALSASHADAVRELLEGDGLGFADVPDMRIARDSGKIVFGVTDVSLPELEIKIGECVGSPNGISVTAEIFETEQKVFNSLNTFCFKYDSVCGNIFLTQRKDGDKIKLSYRNCTKSLKDLFAEKKMTQAERSMTPVIRDEKGVIAVYGFGICQRCKAEPGDKIIVITVNNISGVKNQYGKYDR